MKIKIQDLEREIARKVYGVEKILKQSGTNTWFIKVVSLNHLDEITLQLKDLGFKVHFANQLNKVLYVEWQGDLDSTYYGRQVKDWREKLK